MRTHTFSGFLLLYVVLRTNERESWKLGPNIIFIVLQLLHREEYMTVQWSVCCPVSAAAVTE